MQKIKILKIRDVKTPNYGTPNSAGLDFYMPTIDDQLIDVLYKKEGLENPKNSVLSYEQPFINGVITGLDNSLGWTVLDRDSIKIKPFGSITIPSGIKVILGDNEDLVFIAKNKSGIASKYQVIVGACVVDEDYRGEVHINLINTSNRDFVITSGMKLTQFILQKYIRAEIEECSQEEYDSYKTIRGEGGFGSTGK